MDGRRRPLNARMATLARHIIELDDRRTRRPGSETTYRRLAADYAELAKTP